MNNLATLINITKIATIARNDISDHITSLKLPELLLVSINDNIELETNPFYYCYTSLFTESDDTIISFLNIAGYFYYKYLLSTDAMVDTNIKSSYSNLVLSNIYHESSLRILSSLFDNNSRFWEYWQKRKLEYLNAFKTDKKFLTALTDSEFQSLADSKSANGKTAIDSLLVIGKIDKQEHEILLLSHKFFSTGFQYYDDVLDIKQDIVNRQTNIALCKLKEQVCEEEFQNYLTNPEKAVAKIYISGIARKLLSNSLECFEQATLLVKNLHCPLWNEAISIKHKEVDQMIHSTDYYIESLKIKSRLSKHKYTGYNLEKALHLGANFIGKEQESDGQWKDTPVNGWLSGYWTTGYVLQAISSCNKDLFSSINTSKALTYLQGKSSLIWPYINGWVEDADSTNFALLGLLANNQNIRNEIQELLKYQHKDGGFTTYNNSSTLLQYLNDPNIKSAEGWTQSHVCVSAGTLLVLSKLDGLKEEKDKLIRYLLNNINDSGLWESYWWTSPIYSTALIIEAHSPFNHGKLNDVVKATTRQLFKLQQHNGLFADSFNDKHIFYSSLILNSICSNKEMFSEYKTGIELLAEAIIKNQNEDGSWDSSFALRVPASNCLNPNKIAEWKKSDLGQNIITEDIHRIITTATSFSALSRYGQRTKSK